MNIKTITEECNEPQCLYKRNKTNLLLANIVKSAIISGTGRLSEPLKNNNISIIKIFDCIKSQECIKVINYEPDEANRHLKTISLGPSYLEQQISKAIDKAVEHRMIPKVYVSYLRSEIGLEKEQRKPPKTKQKIKPIKEQKVQDLPNTHILIDLPPLRQSEGFSCGATAIQMVAAYYGCDIRESDLIEKLGITKDSGVKMSKIQEVADELGFITKRKKISYDQIIEAIESKIPMMVAVLRESKNYHHFVMVVGYYNDGLIFRDPAKFTYSHLSKEEFEEKAFGSEDEYLVLAMFMQEEPEYSDDEVEKL